MARKNRVSVYDGVYHVTTRIANRAMLLEPDEVKERLMKWGLGPEGSDLIATVNYHSRHLIS